MWRHFQNGARTTRFTFWPRLQLLYPQRISHNRQPITYFPTDLDNSLIVMNCASEAHDHSHGEGSGSGGHGHGHGDHDHDGHDHDIPLDSGPQDSLFSHIDLPNVVALNAVGGGDSGKNVIKYVSEI